MISKKTERQTQGSMQIVLALSAGFGLVAFLAFMVIGGWGFSPAFVVALMVAAIVFIVLLLGFHSKPDSGPGTGAAAERAPGAGSTGAASASAAPAAAPAPSAAAATADTGAASAPAAAAAAPAAAATTAAPAATAAAAEPAAAAEAPGAKPELLSEAREGGPDDLKRIKGVGPKLEEMLHRLGVFHFDQVASWTETEVAWVDQNLEGFKGRVSRDNWVEQARTLAGGGETEFSSKVKKGDVY